MLGDLDPDVLDEDVRPELDRCWTYVCRCRLFAARTSTDAARCRPSLWAVGTTKARPYSGTHSRGWGGLAGLGRCTTHDFRNTSRAAAADACHRRPYAHRSLRKRAGAPKQRRPRAEPTSAPRICPSTGQQVPVEFGRIRHKFARLQAKFGRFQANLGVDSGPRLAGSGPALIDFGPPLWPNLGRMWWIPWNLADVGRILADSGPHWQRWSNVSSKGWEQSPPTATLTRIPPSFRK